jgi:nitrogen regulatory protein PII
MGSENKFDVIISVVNQGYSDEFMAVAREAGAGGGTVVNARGIAHQGPVKFFGISVQDEKEIIAILSTRERKAPIMQAVSQAFGISSQAEGIIFSLPVDSVEGLDLQATSSE